MYTVVLKFQIQGQMADSQTQFIDGSTRSAASRKAGTFLKGTFFRPVRKNRLDNYEYWVCQDIAEIKSC